MLSAFVVTIVVVADGGGGSDVATIPPSHYERWSWSRYYFMVTELLLCLLKLDENEEEQELPERLTSNSTITPKGSTSMHPL
jgi:hypothetical protein